MKGKKTVVLYPGIGVGHLTPMLELARELLRHGGHAFDVVVALVEPPGSDPGFPGAVARAKASCTSVAYHVLPPPPPTPPAAATCTPGTPTEQGGMAAALRFLRAMNAPLRDFLRAPSRAVHALVLDMFCGAALDVAAEVGVPAYFFFASGGTGLAVFLGLPSLRAGMGTSGFRALGDDAVLALPGAPPFRVEDLPAAMADDGEAAKAMFRMGARMTDARGILVNTFEALEPRAVRSLRAGLCVSAADGTMPPVYCVGPLVSPGDDGGVGKEHACLTWLDAQPDRSVVFLCFGSMGAFSPRQLEQIAVGLESSGQRFLWVVRSPGGPANQSDDDLHALLPAGFLDRTKATGLVVRAWAPQVAVLRHKATGAFVTHCGWNSTLEGVAAGLPLLCWPLYAEQRLNKVWVVEEMRLGVEMERTRSRDAGDDDADGDEEDGVVVSAAEVEAKVRWVMESENGDARALREHVKAASEAAADALMEGGLSRADFAEFVRDLENFKGTTAQA